MGKYGMKTRYKNTCIYYGRSWCKSILNHLLGRKNTSAFFNLVLNLKYFIKLFVFRNLIVKARHSILGVEDRKVSKKFIITLMEDPPSLEAAEKCRQSIRRHGGGEAEYFTAVDERHSEAVFKQYGIAWMNRGKRGSRKVLMGCFSSHFLLWLKCIEIDEPIMILESDALCTRTMPSRLRFRHVINLLDGYYRRNCFVQNKAALFLDKKSYHGSVYYASYAMPRTVAYAVSPDGARRLVKEALSGFARPADEFMTKGVVDVVEHHPPPMKVNAGFPSYIDRKSGQIEKPIRKNPPVDTVAR